MSSDNYSLNGTQTADLNTAGGIRSAIDAVKPRPRTDKQIWGIYIALVLVSLVELYSASSREIVSGHVLEPLLRHGFFLGIGFLIMIGLQRVHYLRFYRMTYVIVFLCIVATVYTMFFGLYINGARRAFSLFGLCTVQPSELIKFSAALVLARYLCHYKARYDRGHEVEQRENNQRLVWTSAITVLIFGVLLIKQGLTNTIIMMVISWAMMIIGAIRIRELAKVMLVYVLLAGGYAVYKYGGLEDKLFPETEVAVNADGTPASELEVARSATHQTRLKEWWRSDKYKDTITSRNSQEQYAYIAQANGGLIGKFPGNSREPARLPLAFSDYIYAIIIEDTGLVGGIALMLLYLWLLARAGRIALQCKKSYPALLVIGMAVFIVCQALMHMGIVTGFFPVSGQPLPLISKGGSSIIITSVALGIMLSVSRFALRKGVKQEANEKLSELSDKDMLDNPTQF